MTSDIDIHAIITRCIRSYIAEPDEAGSPSSKLATLPMDDENSDTTLGPDPHKMPSVQEPREGRGGLAAAFVQPGLATPLADELSRQEIAAMLARGQDPFAESDSGPAGPPVPELRSRFVLVARAAAALGAPAARDALAAEGGLVVVADDEKDARKTLAGVLTHHVLPAVIAADTRLAHLDPRLVEPLELHSDHRKGIPDRRLPAPTATALGQGRTCIAVGQEDHLPDEARLFQTGGFGLSPVDPDMIVAILRASHSRTGQLADTEIRTRLPPETALARLPELAILAAFRAGSTLRVAEALSRFAARLPAPAGLTRPLEPASPALDTVVGLPSETRAPLEALIADLRAWQHGEVPWHDVPASFLLYGLPGTGKTRLARAVAGELGCPLIETSYAEWQSHGAGHLGTTLQAMKASFDQASGAAPCVLFVDELDSFPTRTSGDHGDRYLAQVVNGLLAEMNRLARMEGVVFIGASNHPKAIDPAILRSGRMDMRIHVAPPDRAGVSAILRFYLRDADISNRAVTSVANQLLGLTGADIETVVKRARSLARMSGVDLSEDHLRTAAGEVARPEDAALLRRVAIHEAGHAVVASSLGLDVGRVSIGMAGGQTPVRHPSVMTPGRARDQLTVMLGGRSAELLLCGDVASGGGQGPDSDLAQATALAARMTTQLGFSETLSRVPDSAADDVLRLPPRTRREIEGVMQRAADRATGILRDRQDELEALAARLFEEREIDFKAKESALCDAAWREHAAPAPE